MLIEDLFELMRWRSFHHKDTEAQRSDEGTKMSVYEFCENFVFLCLCGENQ